MYAIRSYYGDENDGSTSTYFVATAINDMIHVISDASEEYSQKPAMKVTQDAQVSNYIQFLRAPYIIGNIQMDAKNYTGPERAERREETYKDIRIQAEELTIHGRRYYIDGTNRITSYNVCYTKLLRQSASVNPALQLVRTLSPPPSVI